MRPAPLLAVLVALIAAPVFGQPAPASPPKPADDDIIGSLLDPNHHPTKEEEDEPDTAARSSQADIESVAPAPGRRRTVPFAAPPRPERDRPVGVDETNRTPDGPANVRDLAYDARLRSSFAA